jgi:acyl-CoA synthetase (AMP-forming)/AMP-acid ligase II
MRLTPTFEHPLAERYTRPGGSWDVRPLTDALWATPRDGDALVDGALRMDQTAIRAAAGAVAGGLAMRGVGRGDVVAWQLPNWHEVVLLYLACWHLGAIAVPLGHRLRGSELARALDLVEPACLLAAPDLALGEQGPAVVVRGVDGAFDELASQPPAPAAPVDGRDLAVGLLTSGSTGEPKVVLHSHRALAYKARVQQEVHGLDGDDVVLMPAPLSHVSGLVNGVLLPGASGMRVVLMETWDPERALDLIDTEHVTFMGGPAVFLSGMVSSSGFAPEKVASLRVCSMGGSTMTPAALATLGERLGCTVKRTYGMTEAATVTTLHAGDPDAKGRETDGRPVGQAEVTVVDPVQRTPLGVGEVGEVWVRGPEMFAGYADASQTTAAVTPEGWLRTGDLGMLDSDGWLTIAGRIKELIIRGGENIASAEVEGLVESHPGVREAVAVGYPDPVLGERVAVVVVAEQEFDLDACRRWFAHCEVAKFKTPEAVVHVRTMPMTATGKPDRAALRTHVAGVLARRQAQP